MIGRKITGSAQRQKSKESAKSSMSAVIQIYRSGQKKSTTPQPTQRREKTHDLPPDNPDVRPTASSPITHFRPPSLFRTDFSPAYAASEPLFHPICGCEAERSGSFGFVSASFPLFTASFQNVFGFVSASFRLQTINAPPRAASFSASISVQPCKRRLKSAAGSRM